jgi:hypothetical protein
MTFSPTDTDGLGGPQPTGRCFNLLENFVAEDAVGSPGGIFEFGFVVLSVQEDGRLFYRYLNGLLAVNSGYLQRVVAQSTTSEQEAAASSRCSLPNCEWCSIPGPNCLVCGVGFEVSEDFSACNPIDVVSKEAISGVRHSSVAAAAKQLTGKPAFAAARINNRPLRPGPPTEGNTMCQNDSDFLPLADLVGDDGETFSCLAAQAFLNSGEEFGTTCEDATFSVLANLWGSTCCGGMPNVCMPSYDDNMCADDSNFDPEKDFQHEGGALTCGMLQQFIDADTAGTCVDPAYEFWVDTYGSVCCNGEATVCAGFESPYMIFNHPGTWSGSIEHNTKQVSNPFLTTLGYGVGETNSTHVVELNFSETPCDNVYGNSKECGSLVFPDSEIAEGFATNFLLPMVCEGAVRGPSPVEDPGAGYDGLCYQMMSVLPRSQQFPAYRPDAMWFSLALQTDGAFFFTLQEGALGVASGFLSQR